MCVAGNVGIARRVDGDAIDDAVAAIRIDVAEVGAVDELLSGGVELGDEGRVCCGCARRGVDYGLEGARCGEQRSAGGRTGDIAIVRRIDRDGQAVYRRLVSAGIA